MGVGGQRHAPAALPPGKWTGVNCIGGWVGNRTGLDGAENIASTGFDPGTVQPVESGYTDWAIPAPTLQLVWIFFK